MQGKRQIEPSKIMPMITTMKIIGLIINNNNVFMCNCDYNY